jgi:HlyD family secretion protein
MHMIKRVIIGIVLLAAVGGITAAGLKPHPPKPVDIQTTKATKDTITRTITAAGKLTSATTVKISSNVSGDLIELHVKVGDRVHKGQVLGRIDPTRYRAQQKSAQAALSASQADVSVLKVALTHDQAEGERIKGLHAKGMTSDAEIEQNHAQVSADEAKLAASEQRASQARAQLDEATDYLSKTTLSAPIDSEVIEVDRQLGERVRGSDLSEDVVMVLATLSQMEVRVEVGEHEVVYLHSGDKAEVELDAIEEKKFPGQVIEIGQNAIIRNQGSEAEVTTFPIRVALDARPPGALPGMSATVHVATETHKDTVVLPMQCVTVRPEKMLAKGPAPSETSLKTTDAPARSELAKVVFVLKDGKAELRKVRTGLSSETQIEITAGLADGDEVISGPYRTLAKELKDGDPVKAEEPGKGGPGGRS